MPNGKPGDGPISDLVNWGAEPFTPEINALIREIVELADGDVWPFDTDRVYELETAAVADPARQPELHRELLAIRDWLQQRPGR